MHNMLIIEDWKGRLDAGLSRRQLESLLGAAQDKTTKQIARDMGIQPDSVQKNLDATRDKLGYARTVRGALLEALKRGIIAPLAVAMVAVLLGGQHQQSNITRRPDVPRRVELRVTARRHDNVWVA